MKKLFLLMLICMIATVASAQETDEPVSIDNYTADVPTLLDELESKGIIPSGAEEAFVQGDSVFGGTDPQFSTFALNNDASNVVMGITLTFTPNSDELEFCAIALRAQRDEQNQVNDDSNVTTIRLLEYLAVGVDNAGLTFTFERGDSASSELALSEDAVDLSETVYLLAVVLDDQLTVYTNGEPSIVEYDVTLDAGVFAFLYAGADEETQCETDIIFAYTFSDDAVDACTIRSNRAVNQRQAPSTNTAVVTQLQPEEALEAIGQIVGDDGFTWWQLADESWVRDDVVITAGFCRALPVVTLENS
ncbi:MAG: hypothetical protein AAFV93_02540 [Chloroflexota bacterium]